ncbi:urease accessory protein UreD [Rhodopseudomonas telluris]|uniref:Urease accessory protein UreD n=1 Tax=Rhodopseudomonas telluris TaxID=644215 RepID=A0ABV6EVC4_9BRAD
MTKPATKGSALLDLSFVRRAGRTVIDRRLFAWPFVLTRGFYLDPERPDRLSLIVQTGSGALHGEDSLVQRLELGPDTAVCLTNQGATSVHHADAGTRATELVSLQVARGASLEYLPEPRILFPDAALSQQLDIDCDWDANGLVVDAFTMHAPEAEQRTFRELESVVCLRRSGGDPVLIDRSRLLSPDANVFRGARAFASAYLMPSSAVELGGVQHRLTEALNEISGVYGAASVMPEEAGLVVRIVAPDLRSVRAAFERIKEIYRQSLPPDRTKRLPATVTSADPAAPEIACVRPSSVETVSPL